MLRRLIPILAITVTIQIYLSIALTLPSLAQDWAVGKPRGTIKVVDLFSPSGGVMRNYAEGLLTTDKDNNLVPCLAQDWRWLNDRTIEFKLREGVKFHNGERFNAQAVRINWEAYRKLEDPRATSYTNLSDDTELEIIDDYTIRFHLPQPDGLADLKFRWFFQMAPSFFKSHEVAEKSWMYLPSPGPWGTGPFKLVEGGVALGRPSARIVLEAFEGYWDRKYPKVKRIIFENSLIGDRKEALRICSEKEGAVDIVSIVRPLDTLKIAKSPFAKIVKSKDVLILLGWINQRKKGSKFRDIKLRKAINYAINRDELLRYAAKGNAYNVEGFLQPFGSYGHNPDLTPYRYDTKKAKALIKEAGYPEGFEIKMIASEAWKLEAQIINRMLERIGLKVNLEVMTYPQVIRKIYVPILDKPAEEQDWDILLTPLGDQYAGATMVLSFGTIEEGNFRWIEYDPVYEKMWENRKKTTNPDAAEEIVRQMGKYNYEHAFFLYVYSPLSLYAVNREVDFIPQAFGYMRFKETSVTENHWSLRGKNN